MGVHESCTLEPADGLAGFEVSSLAVDDVPVILPLRLNDYGFVGAQFRPVWRVDVRRGASLAPCVPLTDVTLKRVLRVARKSHTAHTHTPHTTLSILTT